jgi:glutathione S-transferase
MTDNAADKLNYIRIPKAEGGRAEAVRLCYVLSGKPYVDVLHSLSEASRAVSGKNPFKQFPFVETSSGEIIYQSLAIMHHAAHGTSAWPSDPARLTRALAIAIGGYDLYEAFAGFSADDTAAKKKFEERWAPKYFGALGEIYAASDFAIGDTPTFADCFACEAVAWCVRRNEASRALFAASPALQAFVERFDSLPAVAEFRKRQSAAREKDDSM